MNGIGVSLQSLADTGAHGYLFLSRNLADQLVKSLNISYNLLPHPIDVAGYDGKLKSRTNQYLRLHLTIDGRRIFNAPFIVLDLGKHDCIIGVKFMRHFKLLLEPARSRFRWPSGKPQTNSWSKDILIPYRQMFPGGTDSLAQKDADRRNQLLEKEEQRRQAGRSTRISTIFPNPTRHGLVPARPPSQVDIPNQQKAHDKPKVKPGPPPKQVIDICEISANALHFNMKRPETEFFQTSLYEIDQLIRDREMAELQADEESKDLIERILPKNHQPFRKAFSRPESNRLAPHRPYDHKIHLEKELTYGYTPLYRQSTAELRATKEYLIDNLNRGFIEGSNYPFASPVLFVKKADGSLRFCIDYRKLNLLTRKDAYPLPRIDELLTRVSRAKFFTKLDIRQAFHRIRMDPASEEYTSFRTRYGTYKCKVLPFGLCNGPATYQRYMNDVLIEYLDDFVTAYLDDILIYSDNFEDHQEHVQKVLRRLLESGLQADIKKSEFNVTRTRYLGYILTTEGLEVDPDKVECLRDWKRPTTVTGIKSFLGFCGFYRQFIRNFGKIANPLSRLGRPSEPFVWTDDCDKAFEELKQHLLSIQRIYHFDPDLKSKLETDSSDGVIAGVHSQLHDDGKWYPIGFYSHVLNGHEPNWEIHDKELYAIVEAFKRWRPELMSVQARIDVFSDHRSLEYFMTTKILTAKQVRWMEFLSDFNFQIVYTTGKSNLKADTLTRREQDFAQQEKVKLDSRSRILLGPSRLHPRINAELAVAYVDNYSKNTIMEIDTEMYEKVPLDSDKLRELLHEDNKSSFTDLRDDLPNNYTIEEDLLLYQGRMCVRRDTVLCTRLIQEVHNQPSTAHPGAKKTYQLLSRQYHWPGMETDVKRFVANCIPCGHAHPRQSKQQGQLHPLPVPAYPWQHICMDFKEFNKDKHGYNMILVFIDRLGKDSVSIPCLKTIDARGMAQLYIQWVYRFGHTPETIVSDRGPQFVSSFWQEFCRILGVKVKLSTAYHKETDGQTEIMNRYIDQRLRPFVSYYQDNWSELIPIMDRAQMTLPHTSIGMTPYQLKFGLEPRNSWDWKSPKPATPIEKLNISDAVSLARRMHDGWRIAEDNMLKAQERMVRHANQHRRSIDWKPGDQVYLSTRNLKNYRPHRKLGNKFEGPFEVLERVGHGYRLQLPDGSKIHDIFSPDVLKKYPSNPLPGQESEQPPPEAIAGKEEWEIEEIQASKLARGKLQYLVSWIGHDPDPTWYPASNFLGAPHKLKEFHDQNPTRPGPPARLQEWISAWESGLDEYDHLADDRVARRTDRLRSRLEADEI
jgi:transposase InsO family protein/predicted aspartyl protease